jgi:hypothetical protein
VPKPSKGGRNAQSKSVRGGKGKDGKGKGGKGKGNRRTRRQGSSNDETPAAGGPLVAGKDVTTNPTIQCYGCRAYGHPKKKWGEVTCPYWVVDADGSEYHDPNHKPPTPQRAHPLLLVQRWIRLELPMLPPPLPSTLTPCLRLLRSLSTPTTPPLPR